MQVQSPVDSATMSPVERTAAWVLNNGQYEEDVEETEQNQDEAKHAEKVELSLSLLTYCPTVIGHKKGCLAKGLLCPSPVSAPPLMLTIKHISMNNN